MSNITLAVATFNRIDYLEMMSLSLQESVDLTRINLRVYDDCSSDMTVDMIKKVVPFATEVVVRPRNMKADLNMRKIFEDFLSTEDDYLLLSDSDLIFRPGWLDILLQVIPNTDGILSLYNSRCHQFSSSVMSQDLFGVKRDLGAAGCAFTRERVEEIVRMFPEIPTHTTFDWVWSDYFVNRGLRLYCLRDSYIQHIGIIGQNNHGRVTRYDYGLNFIPGSEANQRIMMKFIDNIFAGQVQWEKEHGIENLLSVIEYDQQLEAKKKTPWATNCRVSWLHYIVVMIRRVLLKLLIRLS